MGQVKTDGRTRLSRHTPHAIHPDDAPGAWPTGHGLGCARQSSGSTAVEAQSSRSQKRDCSIATASPARPGQRAPAQLPAPPRCRRPAGWEPGRGPPSWRCRCHGAPGSPAAVAAGEASIAVDRTGWEGTRVRREWLSQVMRRGQAQGCAWAEPAAAAFLGNVEASPSSGAHPSGMPPYLHPCLRHHAALGLLSIGDAGRHAPGRGRCR